MGEPRLPFGLEALELGRRDGERTVAHRRPEQAEHAIVDAAAEELGERSVVERLVGEPVRVRQPVGRDGRGEPVHETARGRGSRGSGRRAVTAAGTDSSTK